MGIYISPDTVARNTGQMEEKDIHERWRKQSKAHQTCHRRSSESYNHIISYHIIRKQIQIENPPSPTAKQHHFCFNPTYPAPKTYMTELLANPLANRFRRRIHNINIHSGCCCTTGWTVDWRGPNVGHPVSAVPLPARDDHCCPYGPSI